MEAKCVRVRGGLLYVDDEIIQLRMTHNTSNARCNEDII